MRSRLTAGVCALLFSAATAAAQSSTPTEILVRYRSGAAKATGALSAQGFASLPAVSADALRAVNAKGFIPLKAAALGSPGFESLSRTYRVVLPDGADLKSAMARLAADPTVEMVEPNRPLSFLQTPNDPSFNLQWGLKNTGQSGGIDSYDPAHGTSGTDIDAELAWDAQTGSASTLVAVIDSGADYSHPDLAANMWTNSGEIPGNGIDDDHDGLIDDVRGWDFADDGPDPTDDCGPAVEGHGTHVAGIIGAVGNNGTGVTGVNWNVKIMPLRVAGSGTCNIFTSDVADAIAFAVAKGAKVINMSLGGSDSTTLHAACDSALAAGVTLVAAAGNAGNTTPIYPGGYSSVLAVAATDRNDTRASFSNFGSYVAFAAPGVAIRSTVPTIQGSYGYLSGTSMASPMAAGVAALLVSEFPSITPAQVAGRMKASCETVVSPTNPQVGSGRINAARALLTMNSVSPTVINAGSAVTVTISGVSLLPGMTVQLKQGSTVISGTNISIVTPSQATCVFNVSATANGVFDLVASIGNTTVTLPSAVTVTGLRITSVSPHIWPNTGVTGPVSIGGQNFAAGMTVTLRRSGFANIPTSSLVIQTATSAVATFNLSGAAGGRWDVAVASAEAVTTLANGFAVTTPLYQVVTPPVGSDTQFSFATAPGNVIIDWGPNTYAAPTAIDINAAPILPPVDPNRDPYSATGIGVDLANYDGAITFSGSYRITLPYRTSDLKDPSLTQSLTLAYFNTATGRWQPIDDVRVDESLHTVSGTANHFSSFQILQHAPAASLQNVVAYPSPFRPDRGHDRIVFDFLEAGSRVRIYDVSGQLVRDLIDDDGDGRIDWIGVTNSDGEKIASGVYYYVATSGGNKKTGRLAVIR